MGTTNELGIFLPGESDSADLSAVISTLVANMKPLLVGKFSSSSARSSAYPTPSAGPAATYLSSPGRPEFYNPTADTWLPLAGTLVAQNSPIAAGGAGGNNVAAGVAAVTSAVFTGSPGRYVVVGNSSAGNAASTDGDQIAYRAVQFSDSNGTQNGPSAPLTFKQNTIEAFGAAWSFTTTYNGAHTASMTSTTTAFTQRVYDGTSVLVFYLGGV